MSLTIWTQASNQRIGTELHKILVPVEGLARISGFTIGPESITNNTSFKSTGEKWFDRTLLACFPFSISCVTRIFVQATVRVHRLGLVTRSSYSLLPLWASNSPRTDHTWAGLEIAGHRDTVGTVKKASTNSIDIISAKTKKDAVCRALCHADVTRHMQRLDDDTHRGC